MNKTMEFLMGIRILDKSNKAMKLTARGSEPTVRCNPTFSAGNAGNSPCAR